MGISRLTVMMIKSNEVKIINTPERSEAWMIKEGRPHALLLSCPHNKQGEMEQFIADVKSEKEYL